MNLLQSILQSKRLERTRRYWGKTTGLHIRLKRFTPSASEALRTAMLLKLKEIDVVVDIGANTGQFAESLYDFGYEGKVISFEPVKKAYKQLIKRSQKYPHWIVAERCAIGNENGTIKINVSDDSVFSSVLEIEESYTAHNPKSKIIRREPIPVFRLDDIITQYINPSRANVLLKVDTQGYEKEVLEGAELTIPKVQGIKIEIPLYPIYKDSAYTFYDITERMKAWGFQPYSVHVEGVDLNTGRVNTIDGLFFREEDAGDKGR